MSLRPLLIDAAWQLALLGSMLAAAMIVLMPVAGLGWHGIALALITYSAIAALVLARLSHHAPHGRFGLANGITLMRAAYTACLIGALGEGWALSEAVRWIVVLSGLVALGFDGIDGWAARRYRSASAFGARFDMEIDALFVLALSGLVWQSGQAGGWVLTIGLMRYIFVLAGWLWPVLAAPVPPSQRRKAVCVIVIIALLVALVPPVAPKLGGLLCFIGLVLLSYSFAADCVYLILAAGRSMGIGAEVETLTRSE